MLKSRVYRCPSSQNCISILFVGELMNLFWLNILRNFQLEMILNVITVICFANISGVIINRLLRQHAITTIDGVQHSWAMRASGRLTGQHQDQAGD